MAFDSVQVRFNYGISWDSPMPNTRDVPFTDSYFEILKKVLNHIETEYFLFFASFMKLDTNFDWNYIPEQHEKDQIHVWYTTHPMGGLNKEGNVFLIPTQKFKEQMNSLKFLRDFKDIISDFCAIIWNKAITNPINTPIDKEMMIRSQTLIPSGFIPCIVFR